MPFGGAEALCRAASAASPGGLPGADARANLTRPERFATPAENPSEHRHRRDRCEPLTWISNFVAAAAGRLTISPCVVPRHSLEFRY